jgi:UDP-glucose 4-epimerase
VPVKAIESRLQYIVGVIPTEKDRGDGSGGFLVGYQDGKDMKLKLYKQIKKPGGRFGNDYLTIDGTGVRDYIHVVDLANGHLKALDKVMSSEGLGTGTGYSVLEIVTAFEKASGRKVPYRIVDRRPGDVAVCYSDSSKAKTELGWVAERGIEDMCGDSWRWQKNNPNEY